MGADGSPSSRALWPDSRGTIVATLICAVLTLPLTVVTLTYGAPESNLALNAWIIALFVVLHGAALLCGRMPVTAFAIGSGVLLVLALIHIPGLSSAAMMPASAAYLVLVWRMASEGDAKRSLAALLVGLGGAGFITAIDAVRAEYEDPALLLIEAGALAAGIVAAWALGALSHQRALATAQRVEEHTRRALAQERTRIGRDLHDVVSHSLTVMIAQAEAARVSVDDPEADAALMRVAETGRSAMRGLRGMLRVLDDGRAPFAPAPGIDGIRDLVEQARSPEHTIRFAAHGTPLPLAPDAELAAYRLVQEALTNAVRHVRPPLTVDVELDWRDDGVMVSVVDDGGRGAVAASDTAEGVGLIGMRERVQRAGGTLELSRGRGWSVRARLPVEAT